MKIQIIGLTAILATACLSACSTTQTQTAQSNLASAETYLSKAEAAYAAAKPAVNQISGNNPKVLADESYIDTAIADAQLLQPLLNAALPATTGT